MGVFGAPEGAYWLFNFHHVFLLDEEYVWAFQKAVRKKKGKSHLNLAAWTVAGVTFRLFSTQCVHCRVGYSARAEGPDEAWERPQGGP